MRVSRSIQLGIIVILSLLFGCASSSPIQRYNESTSNFDNPPELISHTYQKNNVYRIYHRAATGFVSINTVRQAAEERADRFARRQGKSIIILGEKISRPPYILGNFPRIEIVFALINSPQSGGQIESSSKYNDLEKLKELLDKGIITKEEFKSEKSKILKD